MQTQSPHRVPVDEAAFKSALRQFASGVTVITTRDAGGMPHGMTATAFSSVSLQPPMILVAVGRSSRCHAQIIANERFGVSILRDDQDVLSRYFGGKRDPGFPPPVFGELGGTPILDGAMVALACELEQAIDGGDHTIFIGLVTTATTSTAQPLVHFEGRYRRLAPE